MDARTPAVATALVFFKKDRRDASLFDAVGSWWDIKLLLISMREDGGEMSGIGYQTVNLKMTG